MGKIIEASFLLSKDEECSMYSIMKKYFEDARIPLTGNSITQFLGSTRMGDGTFLIIVAPLQAELMIKACEYFLDFTKRNYPGTWMIDQIPRIIKKIKKSIW